MKTYIDNIEEFNLGWNHPLTFNEVIEHGRNNGANIVNGMPWSWKINGHPVTHENDHCYLIMTLDGLEKFEPSDRLVSRENGELFILKEHAYDTHAPGACPL